MVSVQSSNPFDLLAGGDDYDAPVAVKKADQSAAPAAPVTAPKKNVDKSRAQPQERRNRSEYAPRGGRSAKPAPRVQDGAESRPERSEGDSHKRDHTDHHRGSRGGYNASRGRAFDRRSGGHRDGEKKESQGWGDATANYEEAASSPVAETAPEEVKPEDPEVVAKREEERRLREEEEKQKTLDVYLAEKAKSGPVVALPSGRQANEGADSSQWKDAVVYERVDEDEALFAGKEQTYKKKNKKETAAKTTVDIQLKFNPPPRADRDDRSGRGGHRGGARGGNRNNGDRNSNNRSRGGNERAINMDETAFPTLGGK